MFCVKKDHVNAESFFCLDIFAQLKTLHLHEVFDAI